MGPLQFSPRGGENLCRCETIHGPPSTRERTLTTETVHSVGDKSAAAFERALFLDPGYKKAAYNLKRIQAMFDSP